MKKFSLLFSLLFYLGCLHAQTEFKHPDEILVDKNPLPQVLLIGTWHFNYPGLDAHVTEDNLKMNILSPKRQAELNELLDYIAQFKPTKIAIESPLGSTRALERYRAWKKADRALGASETDQIALRLADRFDLDTLYSVDAYSLLSQLYYDLKDKTLPPSYLDTVLVSTSYNGEDDISKRYNHWYSYGDTMTVEATLLENFQHMNAEVALNRGFGAYLNGDFNTGDYEVADALSANWINRNIRIFRNIQKIDHTSEDRILVLLGAGHIQLLNFFFKCSPQFELVPFNQLSEFNPNSKS